MKFLFAKNWSKYSRQYADNKEELYRHKRIILLSQFTLFGSVIGVIHALEDLVDGLLFMPMMDFIMATFIFICYLLNENGKYKLAKIGLLTFLNLFFFVYSSLAPKDLGIFLYYFPWIGLAAVIFESHERLTRIFYISLSTALLIVLFSTKFQAFGDVNFEAVAIGRSYIINMVSSIIVLSFFIIFMVRMNDSSEKKLYELAEEVKIKNEHLEKANKELDRFLYSTSHDLRAPLMSIKGLVGIAHDEATEEVIKKYLTLMSDRADKLDNFIKDIIDYARNARMDIRPEPIDFNQVIEEVWDNFRFMEGAERIEFVKEINLSDTLVTDKGRLLVIMNNLVSNAIKYGGSSESSRVKISITNTNSNGVEIVVSDNGQGISQDHLERVFEMFYRGTTQSKGSGLGLYIVKEAVEKINGSIRAESELGKGTSFYVTLPLVLIEVEPMLLG